MADIQFEGFEERGYKINSDIQKWVEFTFASENVQLSELNVTLITDEELLDINKEHLNHDYYTDVITFDSSFGPGVQGDIFMSYDRVIDNAKMLGISILKELYRVIIHGCLHLCGYADNTQDLKAQMRLKEDFYLQKLSDLFHVKH